MNEDENVESSGSRSRCCSQMSRGVTIKPDVSPAAKCWQAAEQSLSARQCCCQLCGNRGHSVLEISQSTLYIMLNSAVHSNVL